MPLPFSLTQPLRQGQLTVGAGWRSYFSPFNQALAVTQSSIGIGASIYDLSVFGKLLSGALPPGWSDLGYITKFKMTPGSKTGNIIAGYRGAIRAKYRAEVGEKLSFSFEEMTRMAVKIATGTQVFNILKTTQATAASGPLSATGTPAIPMGASGYIATGLVSGPTQGLPTLFVPAGSGALFPAGTYIVADQDYNTSEFGYVGDAGANVFQGAVTSVDYIRMTSDYVSTVLSVVPGAAAGQDALILSAPFVGGGDNAFGVGNTSPTAGAKVQAIQGYTSREGGTSITEWSAVFVLDTIDASQVLLYYPRIAPDAYQGLMGTNLQGGNSLQSFANDASFDAMAYDDPLDGETVVRYSAYYPNANQKIAI